MYKKIRKTMLETIENDIVTLRLSTSTTPKIAQWRESILLAEPKYYGGKTYCSCCLKRNRPRENYTWFDPHT